MAKVPASNRIAEQRLRRGMSQQQLAEALKVHWTTVSKLERGITRLDFVTAEEIADILKVEVYDLLPIKPLVTIALSGFIHHGGDVEPISEEDEGPDSNIIITSSLFYDVETFWVEVKENALYPYFQDGDLLGVSWVKDEERRNSKDEIDYSPFFGRFCLVEDEAHNQFMGVLSAGRAPEFVTLHNANYPPLTDIKPHALGQVTVSIMATPDMHKRNRKPLA